jgi:hypothetical protein
VNQAGFEPGVGFVGLPRLARGGANLLELPGEAAAEIADGEVQADLHPLPAALGVELIGAEKQGDFFATNHDLAQPFASRHSRSLARAR